LPLIQKSKLKLELKTLVCLQNRRFLTKFTEALKIDDSYRVDIDFSKDPCEDVRASDEEVRRDNLVNAGGSFKNKTRPACARRANEGNDLSSYEPFIAAVI
jgi:hypothetical protein